MACYTRLKLSVFPFISFCVIIIITIIIITIISNVSNSTILTPIIHIYINGSLGFGQLRLGLGFMAIWASGGFMMS